MKTSVLASLISLALFMAVGAVCLGAVSFVKKERVTHVTVIRGDQPADEVASFQVNGTLTVGKDLTVAKELTAASVSSLTGTVQGDSIAASSTLTVANLPFPPARLQLLSTYGQHIAIGSGDNQSYEWKASAVGSGQGRWMPNLEVFERSNPWSVISGEASFYSVNGYTKETQDTIAWLELPAGLWSFTFSCQALTTNPAIRLVPSIVLYSTAMNNVLGQGVETSDGALLASQTEFIVNPSNPNPAVTATVQVPATARKQLSECLRPMVEFRAFNVGSTSTATLTIREIVFYCRRLA